MPAEMTAQPRGVLDCFSLAGRSALVTGAGSGLGLAIAEALAEVGAAVSMADIAGARVRQEASRLVVQGLRVEAVHVDVRDRSSVASAFEQHLATFGGIDVVFCNAGIDTGEGVLNPGGWRNRAGQIDRLAQDAWDNTLATNLTGVFNTISEAARHMKAAGTRGSIIATASNAAFINAPLAGTAYMPSKAGVIHLVRVVAAELAAYGIRVNAISPGPFVTQIGGGGVASDPTVREHWSKLIPLGAMAEPDAIKPLAVYLASEASAYVTGTQMVIDGGMSLGPPIAGGPVN